MKKIFVKTITALNLLLCASVLTAMGSSENSAGKDKDRGPVVHYNSTAEVPFFEDEPKLNEIVLETLRNIQSEFNGIYNATTAADMMSAAAARGFELIIDYGKVEKSDGYIGFIISAYQYTGGVHGNTDLISINYDTKNKKIMTLEEALQPASNDWLVKLSEEARKQLLEKLKSGKFESDEEWIKTGTKPAVQNFDIFKLEGENVRFIFPNYQVGPYSSGISDIVIPVSLFK